MKILKYKKTKSNEYKIITDKKEYTLYDDIIIEYGLLLKKEIKEKEMDEIVKSNQRLKAYYQALKMISVKMRTQKEVEEFLKKKGYSLEEIAYVINELNKNQYLNHKSYIEAYIHDRINLYIEGREKIRKDLLKLGFQENEFLEQLDNIDSLIYKEKIKKYIDKKLKSNQKSVAEFKRKALQELMNKGFYKEDILEYLSSIEIEENEEVLKKLIHKLYTKYQKKYDQDTSVLKVKSYLYQKGYSNIDVLKYLDK